MGTVIDRNTGISQTCSTGRPSIIEKYSTDAPAMHHAPMVEASAGECMREEEVGRRQQPPHAHQREERADDDQQGHDGLGPERHGVHSMTSPRSRNFAIEAEPTKPNRAISSAASKNISLV